MCRRQADSLDLLCGGVEEWTAIKKSVSGDRYSSWLESVSLLLARLVPLVLDWIGIHASSIEHGCTADLRKTAILDSDEHGGVQQQIEHPVVTDNGIEIFPRAAEQPGDVGIDVMVCDTGAHRIELETVAVAVCCAIPECEDISGFVGAGFE